MASSDKLVSHGYLKSENLGSLRVMKMQEKEGVGVCIQLSVVANLVGRNIISVGDVF